MQTQRGLCSLQPKAPEWSSPIQILGNNNKSTPKTTAYLPSSYPKFTSSQPSYRWWYSDLVLSAVLNPRLSACTQSNREATRPPQRARHGRRSSLMISEQKWSHKNINIFWWKIWQNDAGAAHLIYFSVNSNRDCLTCTWLTARVLVRLPFCFHKSISGEKTIHCVTNACLNEAMKDLQWAICGWDTPN